MITVAVICEYNPFHKGHEYQFRKIREEFGEDTAIVAIMSGNYTQRGEVAFAPKEVRAKCAILGGADLVLELPFPFSSSNAEIFARSGVKIANELGFVDYLSFGSESGDVSELERAANIYISPEFKTAFEEASKDKKLGYPEIMEKAFHLISGTDINFTPNNILGIEYIKAIITLNSSIKPHTVKRLGAGYNCHSITDEVYQSASAIRSVIDDESALNFVPDNTRDVVRSAIENGDAPAKTDNLSAPIISFFRLNPTSPKADVLDAGDGLYNRIRNASFDANDISSLIELSAAKNYTKARIRRAILNSFFGVTSSDAGNLPKYTQVLAMNKVGMQLLKKTRESSEFRILTKPSAFDSFPDEIISQKLLSDRADSIYELAKPLPKSGRSSLRLTPFVKK